MPPPIPTEPPLLTRGTRIEDVPDDIREQGYSNIPADDANWNINIFNEVAYIEMVRRLQGYYRERQSRIEANRRSQVYLR